MNIELAAQGAGAKCYCKNSNLANFLKNLVRFIPFDTADKRTKFHVYATKFENSTCLARAVEYQSYR